MPGDDNLVRSAERALRTLKEFLEDIGPRQSGRPTGRRAFSDEECDDLARQALALRATVPRTPWAEIAGRLQVSEKTLRRYIADLERDRKGSNPGE